VDFRDYAKQLLNDTSKSDCLKLALMIYKAGQVWGGSDTFHNSDKIVDGLLAGLTEFSSIGLTGTTASDPNYRVGVTGQRFGTSGFKPEYQDYEPASENQVRHFVGFFAAGYSVGVPLGDVAVYLNEGTVRRTADVRLGEMASSLGGNFFGNYKQLAQDVWHDVCGQSSNLNLP